MMHFLLARAVNPHMTLLQGLRQWNGIAADLREPRRWRTYQADELDGFLS